MDRRSAWAGLLAAVGLLLTGVAGYLFGRAEPGLEGGPLVVLWMATATLCVLWWALHRTDHLQASVAAWTLPAIVGPLAMYPVSIAGDGGLLLANLLWPLSSVPLGLALARLAPEPHRQYASVGVLALVAVVVGLLQPAVPVLLQPAQLVAVAAIAVVPGIVVATGPLPGSWTVEAASREQILARSSLLAACLGPTLTGTVFLLRWDLALGLMTVLTAALALGVRAAVRPLSEAATEAGVQRDLTVAVSERERARLAADLHDGPIQNALLLARRLEASGAEEEATLAREIADELRDLSGDLRLPLLDDLGAGPAIDWLGSRIRRLSGLDVSVSWEATGRPPAPVELAVFRIAQEAMSNAVRHGRPPIRVTYRASDRQLELAVEDAGPAGAGGGDHGGVRLGLVGMTQRAEQIGGSLSIASNRDSGTRVAVAWRATT